MTDSKTDKPRHSKRVIECIDGIMARKDGRMADSKTATEQFAQLLEDYGDECDLWGAGSTRACKMFGLIRDKYEQAIAATLGGIEEPDTIRNELTDNGLIDTHAYLNPDGLPAGLTISDDGNLLNWRGENYVRQGSGTLTAEHAKRINEIIEKHWHDLPADYDIPEATALPGYSYDWQAIADELNAELGSGTCDVECFDDGVDEGMDGEWFSYSPPTWYLSCGHTAQGTEKPNFCPECGKAVKR